MARIRIGDLMVRAGLIDELQLTAALAHQRQWGGRLGDILVSQGFLDEMMLWRGLSKQLEIPLIALTETPIAIDVLRLVPLEMCTKHELFPIVRDDRTLTVAISDPNNIGHDEVAFRTGLKVKTVLAPNREIEWAINRYYRGSHEPCPPPRTRPADRSAGVGRMENLQPTAHAPASTLAPRTVATPLAQVSAPSVPSQIPVTLAPKPSNNDEFVRQQADALRAVIDLCIRRGVFTRDELWEHIARESGRK